MRDEMKLRVYLIHRDDEDREVRSIVDLDPDLEARIIQEEVWTQTAWPPGEVPLVNTLRNRRVT